MTPASANPSETAPDPAPRPRHPLTLPHFRNLWIGGTISLLGDQFYLVALPWLVLKLTSSGLALGTMLGVAAIPRAALMLVGGAVTDRFSARRVLLSTASSRAILVGTVALLVWLGRIQLWELYVLTFAFGVADAFSFPASSALIPSLVQPEQLQSANALFQTSAVLTQMIGPAPASLLIKIWGIASALFADSLSFVAVIAALIGIPEAPKAPAAAAGAPARPSMLHSIAEGLRAVRSDPPLLWLMAVFATLNFCVAGPIGVGLAALAKFKFQSEVAFGTLLTCFSAGTLGGILLATRVKPRKRGLQFIAMGLLTGLEMATIGLVPKFAVIATVLALMGLGVGFVNVQFSSWIQRRVDRSVMGRVMSVLMFSAVGLIPFSYAVAGVLAQWNLDALFISAGAVLVVASGVALSGKAAREID